MNTKIDFINGNTNKSLIKMFIPLLMAMTLTMLYNMVDGFWVGNMLGEQGMSALTAGTALVLIMNSLAMGMGNGVSVMFAHLVGSGKKEQIPGAAATVLLLGTAISVAVTVLIEILLGPILCIMGTPAEIFSDALSYLRIYFFGNAALFLYMLFTSIFRAFGDPVFQMKGMVLTVIFNAALDPLFIKFFRLTGAAAVTVASELLCLVYAAYYYKKTQLFTMNMHKVELQYAKTMLSLSIPTTVQAIMPPISSAVMLGFISPFGLTALAGFGVARNLELIMFMPTTGMCMALTSIAGQCEGAGRRDRAQDYLKAGLLIGGVMIAIFSAVVILCSGNLTALFGQGKQVAEVVATFFQIISVGYVLYMLTSCMQGYITGIGKPGEAMLLLILYYIVFRIPAAYYFGNTRGLTGIWIAFLISHILAFVVAGVMTLRSGHKKTVTIHRVRIS